MDSLCTCDVSACVQYNFIIATFLVIELGLVFATPKSTAFNQIGIGYYKSRVDDRLWLNHLHNPGIITMFLHATAHKCLFSKLRFT